MIVTSSCFKFAVTYSGNNRRPNYFFPECLIFLSFKYKVGAVVVDRKCTCNMSTPYVLAFVNKLYSHKAIFLRLKQMST